MQPNFPAEGIEAKGAPAEHIQHVELVPGQRQVTLVSWLDPLMAFSASYSWQAATDPCTLAQELGEPPKWMKMYRNIWVLIYGGDGDDGGDDDYYCYVIVHCYCFYYSYGVIIMFVIDYVYVDLRCHVTWTVVEFILVFGW